MTTIQKINKTVPPRKEKMCKCGCNEIFTPSRTDQIYLDTKHANFAYNHGQRKKRYASENQANKILRYNDRILEKYFKCSGEQRPRVNLTLLEAEGFNENCFFQVIEIEEKGNKYTLISLYNYAFRIFNSNNLITIEIQKI